MLGNVVGSCTDSTHEGGTMQPQACVEESRVGKVWHTIPHQLAREEKVPNRVRSA